MIEDNLLQNRINELDSAIINFVEEKAHIIGFYNADMLRAHLEQNTKNWSSIGMYDKSDVTFFNIKNEALFLVQTNGVLTKRYQFTVIFRDTVQRLKNAGSVIVTVRKNVFADQWQVLNGNDAFEFSEKDEVDTHLEENYKNEANSEDYKEI